MSNKFLSEEHTNLPKILTVTALLGVCGLAYAATTIINTTPKLTTGDNEDALFIFEDDSTIVNTSTVTTLGISADALRIDGLHARITNTATGELITQGEHFAVGIRLGRETAVVDNAGSITTSGSNGDGIVLFGGNGYVTNSGSILVQGTGADGFVVEGANTTLINSGSIQSTGAVRTEDPNGNPIFDDATGVYLAGSFNRLDNHAGAVIETTGPDANSLNAYGNGSLVNNHGLISSTGLDSRTVSILGNSNQTSVLNNTGEIINSGDRSGANSFNGLAVANFGPALLIDNSGLIESTGANGVALYSRTWPTGGPDQPDTFVLNSGLISASGVNSQATILLIGSDQFIENLPSGVIQQLATGQPAIMNPSGGIQSVNNSGLIIGDVFLGDHDDQFTVIDAGNVQGAIDGGADMDHLGAQMSGPQILSGNVYSNFESFNKTGNGTLNAQGTWNFSASGMANISDGAMCLGGGSELIAATLTVASGATLCGTGILSAALIAEPGSIIGPGFSPGTLTINDEISADQARIIIEIAGLIATEHDRLAVNGDALITNSTLVFSFIDNFLPGEGDTVQWLLSSGSVLLAGSEAVAEGVAPGFDFEIDIDEEGIQLIAKNDAEPVSQSVQIDLAPGDKKNHLDPNSGGYAKVAVLSTNPSANSPGFDAQNVDPATVTFGPDSGSAIMKKTKYRDVNHDGLIDTVLSFSILSTGIQCGDSQAGFEGLTFGQSILSGQTHVTTEACD